MNCGSSLPGSPFTVSDQPRRMIVGITGASGIVYGIRCLETLGELGVETHLVMSRTAEVTLAHETDLKVAQVKALASAVHRIDDLAAAPSSGSFPVLGMIVAPCSMRTLAEIAAGLAGNLITRAADVTLKERRRLVLMARETPLHLGHIRAMATVTELGAIVAPPVPAFYSRPASLEEMVDHSVGRVLDLFGLDSGRVRRWGDTDR
nr:UbiX family flavin prenyltransferase [Roseospirillum parvum]